MSRDVDESVREGKDECCWYDGVRLRDESRDCTYMEVFNVIFDVAFWWSVVNVRLGSVVMVAYNTE